MEVSPGSDGAGFFLSSKWRQVILMKIRRPFFVCALSFLCSLLFLVSSASCAAALEISAQPIVSFGDNPITVISEEAGSLTVTPAFPDFDLKPIAENLQISAGETRIVWDGLSWGGEPLARGKIILRATLTTVSGRISETSCEARVSTPLCAAVLCLPQADTFCPAEGSLRVDCGLSRKGTVVLEIVSAEAPETVLRTFKKKVSGTVPITLQWDGTDQRGQVLPAGDYFVTAFSEALPEIRQSAAVHLEKTAAPAPELRITGSLFPEDPENDQQVWAALTAPAVVGAGSEGQGLYLMKKKKYAPGGSISCRTAAVNLLEIGEDGWCRVAAWRQGIGEYMEGYVQREKLTVIAPRQHYGVLIRLSNHTMTVYEDGKPIGSLKVSTGLQNASSPLAATPPGVYLLGSRMQDFQRDGFHYDYPIRLHGDYLLHTVGYQIRKEQRDYSRELEALGGAASHGCIRMDVRCTGDADSLNAWWVWTHLGRDTRVIVME